MIAGTHSRVFDLDEVERLLAPYTNYPHLTLERPAERLVVEATLVGRSAEGTHAAMRAAGVEAGNAAIAAVEAAGYEHVDPPQIDIGGIETPDLAVEACLYIVDATLHMTLLGKRGTR